MKSTRSLTVVSALFVPFLVALAANGPAGCKKDETEPVPSAAPPPPATPTPVNNVVPEEDAGLDAGPDGDASDGKKPTGTGDPTGIRKCCTALRQNAKSAPPEQQGALLAAAGVCDSLVNNPQGRQALSQIRGILKGANMPGECQ